MEEVLRKRIVVQKGGRVVVDATGLPEGAEAELILRIEEADPPAKYRDLIGSGKGAYSLPEEALEFLRRERDAWDK